MNNRAWPDAAPGLAKWWQFNRPTALKAAGGFLGSILCHVDDALLVEAERRAHDGWGKGWDFLSQMPGLPPYCYDFFRAARSAELALRRLMRIAGAVASQSRDPLEEFERGGPQRQHRINKVFGRIYDLGGLRQRRPEWSAAQWNEIVKRRQALEARRRAAHRRLRPPPITDQDVKERLNQQESLLAGHWLALSVDQATGWAAPGFCFFTDAAMSDLVCWLERGPTDFLSHCDRYRAWLRKVRQRLGLVHMPRRPVSGKIEGQRQFLLRASQKGRRIPWARLSWTDNGKLIAHLLPASDLGFDPSA